MSWKTNKKVIKKWSTNGFLKIWKFYKQEAKCERTLTRKSKLLKEDKVKKIKLAIILVQF